MTMREETTDYDAIVLGAGIAGLVAATSASESGLRVALLEKTADVGGSSAMSGGFFAFSGTAEQAAEGVEDSAELFLDDLREAGGHRSDPALLAAYLENQDDTYHWLKQHGADFTVLELSSGQSAPRSHLTAIRDLLRALTARFLQAGGTLLLEHEGTSLHTDEEGRVVGVDAVAPDGEVCLRSRGGVVIASGGFSRSAELLGLFAPDQLAAIPYGGKANTGDGLRMAWALGAGLADVAYIAATYGSHPDTGEDFHELLTAFYLGAIIVNKDGQRFVDESLSYKTIGAAVLGQPEGLGYQIFDAGVRARSHPGVPLNDIGFLEGLGHVHKADSLEELAEVCGIRVDALRRTVSEYNRTIAEGDEDPHGRTHLCNGVGDLVPVQTGPFYAYPAKALMTSTYCGLTITPLGEVRAVTGRVIPGLYAIGEVTGGFHGKAYMTGTSLGKGAVFGRIVAKNIAAGLRRR
ncbi:fumarate reductase flavoprotein subunit [Microbacterium resistens]|uniref:Fumarate reductase flavoprotein subunit n=1 Tax=Microbacterium resistens TaxID=156977 RepID=A0ABU1SDC4_9MICO|nr:FAD-dependent oxidoreductase [Microbacterium resistens]MDR6867600.1 fumarate reductase flavoprotein subunit [Microbacterium resistens]